MPSALPSSSDSVNAAATRPMVIARFHGSAPEMVCCTIARSTAVTVGSSRLCARLAAICQASRNTSRGGEPRRQFALMRAARRPLAK